mgnify:CR=1 FL=1
MKTKKKNEGRNKYYSISNKLKKDGKSSEEFEIIFNALSLEEVIGLKLELASKSAFKGKLYGLPLWYSTILKKFLTRGIVWYRMSDSYMGITEIDHYIILN